MNNALMPKSDVFAEWIQGHSVALFILAYPITFAIWWFGRPIMLGLPSRGHWTDFAIAALPALIV